MLDNFESLLKCSVGPQIQKVLSQCTDDFFYEFMCYEAEHVLVVEDASEGSTTRCPGDEKAHFPLCQ